MTIRSIDRFVTSLWDWNILAGCFPRTCRPTDIDGMVEIGGHYLVMEGKGRGVEIPVAQRRMFSSMAYHNRRLPGLFAVIVFWGVPEARTVEQIQFWPSDPMPGNLDMLRDYVTAWAGFAEEHKWT